MKLQGKLSEGSPEKNDFTDEFLNDTAGETALVSAHVLWFWRESQEGDPTSNQTYIKFDLQTASPNVYFFALK